MSESYIQNAWDWSPLPSRASSPVSTVSPMDLTLVQAAGMPGHRVDLSVHYPFSPPRALSPDLLPMSARVPSVAQYNTGYYGDADPMYLWNTQSRYRLHGASAIVDASTRIGSASPVYPSQNSGPSSSYGPPSLSSQPHPFSGSQEGSSNYVTLSSDSQPYETFGYLDDTYNSFFPEPNTTPPSSNDANQMPSDSQPDAPYTYSKATTTTRRGKRNFSTFQQGQATASPLPETSFTENENTDLDDYASPGPVQDHQPPHISTGIDNTYIEPSLRQDQSFHTCSEGEHHETDGSDHASTEKPNESPVSPDTTADKSSPQGSCAGKTADEIDVDDEGVPYAQLIYRALMSVPGRTMILADIYEYFKQNIPRYAKMRTKGWQNSIRHNLSMNGAFQKRERPPTDKGQKQRGFFWTLSSEAEAEGVKSTTRFRKPPNSGPPSKKKKTDQDSTKHETPSTPPPPRTRTTRSSGRRGAQNVSKKTSANKTEATDPSIEQELDNHVPGAQLQETNLPQANIIRAEPPAQLAKITSTNYFETMPMPPRGINVTGAENQPTQLQQTHTVNASYSPEHSQICPQAPYEWPYPLTAEDHFTFDQYGNNYHLYDPNYDNSMHNIHDDNPNPHFDAEYDLIQRERRVLVPRDHEIDPRLSLWN